MRAKPKVVARFPDAKLVETAGNHWAVLADGCVLDIYPRHYWQGKTAAWRSAYFWCVRNPAECPECPEESVA